MAEYLQDLLLELGLNLGAVLGDLLLSLVLRLLQPGQLRCIILSGTGGGERKSERRPKTPEGLTRRRLSADLAICRSNYLIVEYKRAKIFRELQDCSLLMHETRR